jgi:hypothetical protein
VVCNGDRVPMHYITAGKHLSGPGVGPLLLAEANHCSNKCCVRDRQCRCVGRAGRYKACMLTNVDETAVVLDALHGTTLWLLLLVLRWYLGRLPAHLTGTRQRTVDLTYGALNGGLS